MTADNTRKPVAKFHCTEPSRYVEIITIIEERGLVISNFHQVRGPHSHLKYHEDIGSFSVTDCHVVVEVHSELDAVIFKMFASDAFIEGPSPYELPKPQSAPWWKRLFR